MLLGEDAELDREFWGHSTWHEEANDEDWVPGEEDRVNDSTTSSGESSGTESDATTTADAEQALELVVLFCFSTVKEHRFIFVFASIARRTRSSTRKGV